MASNPILTFPVTEQLDEILSDFCEGLQLTPTQHRQADERYHAICDWLAAPGSPVRSFDPDMYPQGSLAIGTTTRPLRGEEFDLDFVCEFRRDPRSFADPCELLHRVRARLDENGTYQGMTELKRRCVRVTYANDFHMDILPACPDPALPGAILVPDRNLQRWCPSNPRGYARWFNGRTVVRRAVLKAEAQVQPLPRHETHEEKAPLKLAVQLLKRWRDVAFEEEVAPISIVLTTLAGTYYDGSESVHGALGVLLDTFVDKLPAGLPPRVENPVNPKEDFAERWTPEAYALFLKRMKLFQRAWHDLTRPDGIDTTTRSLTGLFGTRINESIAKAGRDLSAARDSGTLHILKGSGTLSAAAGIGRAIAKNTFYGE